VGFDDGAGKPSTNFTRILESALSVPLYNQRMATYTRNRPTYQKVFSEVLRLSRRDQRKLQGELAKLAGVVLVQPVKTSAAILSARKLADEVRKEVKSSAGKESLDGAMQKMRGRAWS
jgi:hypothetical protein